MSPATTVVRIEELTKRDLTLAWITAALTKVDGKKFPKKPEQLWGGDHGEADVNAIVATAKALKAGKENAALIEAQKRSPRRKKKRSR